MFNIPCDLTVPQTIPSSSQRPLTQHYWQLDPFSMNVAVLHYKHYHRHQCHVIDTASVNWSLLQKAVKTTFHPVMAQSAITHGLKTSIMTTATAALLGSAPPTIIKGQLDVACDPRHLATTLLKVCDLADILDGELTTEPHTANVVWNCFYQLYQLCTATSAFTPSCVNYCDTVLYECISYVDSRWW